MARTPVIFQAALVAAPMGNPDLLAADKQAKETLEVGVWEAYPTA
jgi:hypothetical protein